MNVPGDQLASYYRNITESIFSGFVIYNADHHRVVDCNTVAAGMIGTVREKLIGQDVRNLFPPDDREVLFGDPGETPVLTMVESHMTTGTGDILHIILSRGAIGEPEEKLLIINVLDITHRVRMESALRESRKRYHELYDTVPIGLFRSTMEGAILETNRAAIDILGYPDALSLNTANVARLFADQEDRRVVLEALAEPGSHLRRDVLLNMYSGGTIWVRLTLRRAVSTESGLTYLDGAIEDISEAKARESERKTIEAIRNRMQRMEAIETLTGGIAHEFNNILAGMSLHLQVLSRRREGGAETSHAEELMKLVRRAEHAVDGLLSTLGTVPERDAVLDLGEVVDAALNGFRDGPDGTERIRWEYRRESLPVRGTAESLATAIREVVANALTASEPDGAVDVAACRRGSDPTLADIAFPSDTGYAVVEIRDRGIGMDPETADRILEPFFTTEEFGKGKGLGLTRAYGIVKRHDGALVLDSRPGEGTVVTFFFRLVVPEENQLSG